MAEPNPIHEIVVDLRTTLTTLDRLRPKSLAAPHVQWAIDILAGELSEEADRNIVEDAGEAG